METMIAICLMTMTAWSLQVLYANLLKGSRMSDSRRAAIAEADALFKDWQRKALTTWPQNDEDARVEGVHEQYTYAVDFSGLLRNPYYTGPEPPADGDPSAYLQLQTLTMTLYYTEKTRDSETQHLIKLVGSVSR